MSSLGLLVAVRFKNAAGEPNGLQPGIVYAPERRRYNRRWKRNEVLVDPHGGDGTARSTWPPARGRLQAQWFPLRNFKPAP